MMKNIIKFSAIVIFGLALISVSMKLFVPKIWGDAVVGVKRILGAYSIDMIENHELTIVYADDLNSMSPLSYGVSNRARLLNVYEGLVMINKTLGIEPGLARSYGLVDDVTWEFTLRPGVKFHDGTDLDMQDVLVSFAAARNQDISELAGLMSNISDIKPQGNQIFRIATKIPDPLLLNKVAAVLIFPSEKIKEVQETPIGSGPYKFVSYEKGKYFKLEAFEDYWGEWPLYRYASINTISSKEDRFSQMKEGRIDILAAVPINSVEDLKSKDISVTSNPSLEVNFLIFNLDEKSENIFRHRQIREAVAAALNKEEIAAFMKGYALSADQFVSRGILGYSKDLTAIPFDLKKAPNLVKEIEPFLRLKATLDLVKGPEVFGDYIKRQFFSLGIDLELNYLTTEDFEVKIKKGDSDFYFLGWRAEFGDITDFLASVIHSKTLDSRYGQFNGTSYQDKDLDSMIEEAETSVNTEKRIQKVQAIMKKLVSEDVFGVPLFETQVVYGLRREFNWKPRMDGYVLASEVR